MEIPSSCMQKTNGRPVKGMSVGTLNPKPMHTRRWGIAWMHRSTTLTASQKVPHSTAAPTLQVGTRIRQSTPCPHVRHLYAGLIPREAFQIELIVPPTLDSNEIYWQNLPDPHVDFLDAGSPFVTSLEVHHDCSASFLKLSFPGRIYRVHELSACTQASIPLLKAFLDAFDCSVKSTTECNSHAGQIMSTFLVFERRHPFLFSSLS